MNLFTIWYPLADRQLHTLKTIYLMATQPHTGDHKCLVAWDSCQWQIARLVIRRFGWFWYIKVKRKLLCTWKFELKMCCVIDCARHFGGNAEADKQYWSSRLRPGAVDVGDSFLGEMVETVRSWWAECREDRKGQGSEWPQRERDPCLCMGLKR